MIIQSDDKAVEKELKALEKLLVDNGAWYHDELSIISKNGDISVRVNEPMNPGELIAKVPDELLVPYQGLNVSLKGDVFSCAPDEKILSPLQIEIGQHMIKLYNLTNKAAIQRGECAFIKFREAPELLELLLSVRTVNQQVEKKLSYLRGEEGAMTDDEFTCWSFLQTRILGKRFKNKGLVQILMPFIDFLNHDHRGCHFSFHVDGQDLSEQEEDGDVDDGPSNLHMYNQQPFLESSECYACYGIYDTLDTFLSYGFPDTYAPFVRSIPLSLSIGAYGKINIKSIPLGVSKQKIPTKLEDIKKIMPTLMKHEKNLLELSHLLIPIKSSPHSMRRILRAFVQTLLKDNSKVSQQFVIDQTYKAERDVLKANIDFYQDVLEKVEKIEAPQTLKDDLCHVANLQLNKLHKYLYKNDFFALKEEDAEMKKVG